MHEIFIRVHKKAIHLRFSAHKLEMNYTLYLGYSQ